MTDLGGSAPERTLRQQFESPQAFDAAVQALRKRRLLRADASLTQKASEKTIKVAALAVSAEEAEQFAAKKQFSAPLQAALLRLHGYSIAEIAARYKLDPRRVRRMLKSLYSAYLRLRGDGKEATK